MSDLRTMVLFLEARITEGRGRQVGFYHTGRCRIHTARRASACDCGGLQLTQDYYDTLEAATYRVRAMARLSEATPNPWGWVQHQAMGILEALATPFSEHPDYPKGF